ncbi:MAG: hypothetical protein Q9227_001063 [Pyrenula ochraceoflavens]
MASQRPEPIAIVGSGCRFPGGSTSPSSLWELLQDPHDIRKDIPLDRFDVRGCYHPDAAHHGTTNVRHSYLLEDVRAFDAGFFNISRKEAESIDPQQRMLMETVYEALESGGHTIEALRNSDTAVYVGVMGLDYENVLMRDLDNVPTYAATGISRAILSNRISYFFDWHGPSLTIDTACSSSLIAVHQGVQALRTGESHVAVACGTTTILGADPFMTENRLNMLSPNGRSRSEYLKHPDLSVRLTPNAPVWDADADGYARGEGVAVVILKRLSDAMAEGDHIECLIRETGSNQDGRSTGLTVPSSAAQAALIRQTYSKAGLNPRDPKDQPQFFEAHGTGTKAGDPREAEAIQQCFKGDGKGASEHPLYVGSIKTVIGHTEGAAGLAGLIKGSLAVQHGVIPANLHFDRLNPAIEPFYRGLNVPTRAMAWPSMPEGTPRRVSVNSFGFGGANAHAILESYQPPIATSFKTLQPRTTPFTPFTFSAVSESSLFAQLEAYSKHLKSRADVNLYDLAWTLQTCRSALPIKMTFSARTLNKLISKLDDVVSTMKQNDMNIHKAGAHPKAPRILGIFTGQGAQWPAMGAHLIRSSAFVRSRLEHLEKSLTDLPLSSRPKWRLKDEILAGEDISRISEAQLSQPLCTAIQIILVDLLREAGISFEAVVGHSSGEIAAAYAADYISACDAIRIAYYRGLHVHLAGESNGYGKKGAMLAVGTSWEDALDLVELPAFKGRLSVAAHNSSASITLSGDNGAIVHAKKVFDEEKKFARALKVDIAYHSHQMLPSGDPYIQSLQECGIRVNNEPRVSCSWYSSVIPEKAPIEPTEALKGVYWRDNMVKPVLFADAIKNAANDKLNFALEVGPHAALKGPATQNILEVRSPLAYSGALSRGEDDVEAFADALGFVWAQLGSNAVNFRSYEDLMSNGPPPKFVLGLPSYQWNHERSYWHESRQSKTIRSRTEPFHDLLGIVSPDSTNDNRRWKNLLKASEIPWLDGHRLENQMIFPAAGYITMALEAARKLAGDRDVKVYEIRDLVIGKAISFEDDTNFGVETLVTLSAISTTEEDEQSQIADFSCHACANNGPTSLDLVSSGKVVIVYGTPAATTLTSIPPETSNMNDIDAEIFYSSISKLGYGYTGPFRSMSSIKRKLNHASAMVSTYTYPDDATRLIVHPTWLDVAIQASLAAGSHPEDENFRTLSVPTVIGRIRVNPQVCAALPISETLLPICATIHRGQANAFSSSFDIFSDDGQQTLVQAEGLEMKSLYSATANDDRRPFTYVKWGFDLPNTDLITRDDHPSAEDIELATLCERMSYFYLQKWKSNISEEEWGNSQPHHLRLRNYMDHALSVISRRENPWVKEEWSNDNFEDIEPLIKRYSGAIDVRIIKTVGENLPAVVRGETTMIEHLTGMMEEFYVNGLGFPVYSAIPGAGTGGTTKEVLQAIGNAFSSYDFTDISEGYFGKAEETFKTHSSKMIFRGLDIEQSPASQGFQAHSYDMVIAANVLHATSSLQKTLENTRQLLKPGGRLVFVEITQSMLLRFTNMAAGLSGWWNSQDGRENGPLVTPEVWHSLLRKAGFSGVDAITPSLDNLTWPFSAITTQAVNNQIDFLRRPLSPSPLALHFEEIVVVGTASLETSRIAEEVGDLVGRYCDKVTMLYSLPTESDALSPMSTVVSLVDIDEPVFKNLSQKKMAGLKKIYDVAKNLIWVTHGAQDEDPYQMASIGLGRALRHEIPYLTLTFLDLSHSNHNVAKVIVECLLRQCALDEWQSQGLTWSQEPEYLLENGQLMIPRLVANHDQNDRFNSHVRSITKTVSPSQSSISISKLSEWPPALHEDVFPPVQGRPDIILVQKSLLVALHVAPNAFLFLSIGVNQATGRTMIALSDGMSSRIRPLVAVPLNHESPSMFAAVLGELLAASLMSALPFGSTLLVHEPALAQFFTTALTRRAPAKAVRVNFSTVSTDGRNPDWTSIDTWTSRQTLRRRLPADITHYLDLSTKANSNAVSASIASALSLDCRQIDASDLFRRQSRPPICGQADLSSLLEDAVCHAHDGKYATHQIPPSLVVPLSQISHTRDPLSIVDWTSSDLLTLQTTPIDATRLFSKHKTYLLVGLTGQIGQSMSEWMARNGAGYICLTSRRPNVAAQWLDSFKTLGTIVKVFPMDVSNKKAVKEVVEEIEATCPPVAGVANGAMVLNDVLFSDMSCDQMENVLKPKIDGSNHLADAFRDHNLDFFVMFSSLSAVVGNAGQSNYAAANAYMQSLAKQRRKRGLAASTFDIGRVVGIGYVERADPIVKEQLVRQKYLPVSEADFHQLFAETVLAGHPDIGSHPVLTTAIFSAIDDEYRPHWADDPRFSHCVITDSKRGAEQRGERNNSLSVFDQLSSATTMDEALDILKASFVAQLRLILQITEQHLDEYVPIIDLGIDSLIAVEVRSWFVKELKVDLPVLKILGGGSIADLSEQALKQLPEKVLANIEKGGDAEVAVKPLPAPAAKSQPEPSLSSTVSVSTPPESSTPDTDSNNVSSAASSTGVTEASKPEEKPQAKVVQPPPKFLKSELVSFAQSRFWFLRLLLQDQTTFNVIFYYKVTGNLRIDSLDRAVRAIGSRHEALRTCFIGHETESDTAYQKVMETSALRLEQRQIDNVEDVAIEYANLKRYQYNIESGELMRLILLSLNPSTHYLLVGYHHILMDGISVQIFFSDLEKAYKGQSLGPLPRQITSFSKAQRDAYENGNMHSALRFWQGIYSADPPVLPLLPIAKVASRVPMNAFDVHQAYCRLDSKITQRTKQVSKAQRSTPFHLYLAVFATMLFKFTKAKDLTIGIADADRSSDAMGTIGLFINLLPLHFRRTAGQRFADVINDARNKAYAALASSLPFDVLLNELNVPRSSLSSPFFQAFFDYRQGTQDKQSFDNCQFEMIDALTGRTAYDITLDVTDSAAGTIVAVRTQTSLYDQAATDLDASSSWEGAPLFTSRQLNDAVEVGRGPNLRSNWPETLPHRIDQIANVMANRDKIAVMDGVGNALTYTKMAQRVEAIGETLVNAGIGLDSRVLVFQQATSDWVCSMLAIMRIGGIYVPLDLRNPLSRLANIAQDCQPSAILVDPTTANDAIRLKISGKVINVGDVGAKSSAPMPNRARADSIGAILYTSGSTGTPKGILVKHSGLRNEIEGYTKTWELGAERVLQQSAFTFNHSSDQIYTALVNGGMVYIVPWSKRGDPLGITDIICRYNITYTKATPSEYALWLQYGMDNLRHASTWRFAFGGGETLTSTILQDFKALDLPQLRFFNSYGPTEISISSHKTEIEYRDALQGRIPCGYSLPNYVTYILSDQLEPLPPGMPGAVFIGGAGLAKGYLNNKELSENAFIPDPYAESHPGYVANGWTRMYRTGDIGHLTEDGALVFHNRIAGDTQIKIRGLRIELSDIESNVISAAGGVLREAVVTLRECDMLVAHVVFAPQHGHIDKEDFLRHLLSRLPIPQYMIPIMAIPLERFPLNNHSKVDRKAIKDLALPRRTNNTENDNVLELSETMILLKRVWEDVLGNHFNFSITPTTSFFAVGGNSLLIVRLQSRIRSVFRVVVPIVELLGANTLGEMSQRIDESSVVELIDWNRETRLPDLDVSGFDASKMVRPVRSDQKTVLLTGATGFLAKYLLPHFVNNPSVSKVYCVAVRNHTTSKRAVGVTDPKIISYEGDLSSPRFGLSESTFATLSGEVDVVLHMGAARSFWDSYHTLQPTNVNATKELVRLAAARRIPIIYTSSAGVVHPPGSGSGSAAANVPPTDGSDGYVASKWASERVLERAADTLGLPVSIHRFMPSSSEQSGQDRVVQSVLGEFARFAEVSKLMPDLDGWEGRIELMSAEQAALRLSEAVVNEKAGQTSGARYAHHVCEISIGVDDMKAYMLVQKDLASYERMAGIRWVGRIKALGFGYLLASQNVSLSRKDARLESRR